MQQKQSVKLRKSASVKNRQKYQEEHGAWEKACAAVKAKRADAVVKHLDEDKARLKSEDKNRYDSAVKLANNKKAEQTRKKSEAEKKLAGLGFFMFNDKKIQKTNIEAAVAGIAAAEADLKKAEKTIRVR